MISVIMSCYNAEKYLSEAIESILGQTYEDFEFIIIDDGSTDSTLDIINYYNDNRIKFYSNEGNKGLIYSLNKAVKIASRKYIVRMDADDISAPDRFYKQFNHMENHPGLMLSGTNAICFDDETNYKRILPSDSRRIEAYLFIQSSFIHPSVIIRREVFSKFGLCYDTHDIGVEDYSLWSKVCKDFKTDNLDEFLLKYRLVSTGVTKTEEKKTSERFLKLNNIHRFQLARIGTYSQKESEILTYINNSNFIRSELYDFPVNDILSLIEKIKIESQKIETLDYGFLVRKLSSRFVISCLIKRRWSFSFVFFIGVLELLRVLAFRVVMNKKI